jgi:hypothetical protein
MKTKAGVLWGLHEKWEVEEVDLDGPKEREVMVKLTASGLCHSDDHLITGDMPTRRDRCRRGRSRGAQLHPGLRPLRTVHPWHEQPLRAGRGDHRRPAA